MVSLYFHLPFCTRKCDYCHFYVIPDRPEHRALFMHALKQEWERRRPLLKGKQISSIYFGGGTPALLGPDAIAEILSWIAPDPCEITLEANPEHVPDFASVGVNRLSLGVQSLDDTELVTLSRTHNVSKALRAIENSTIKNLSIDLMYDVPGQTPASWKRTLERATQLPITHLSLYNLTIEPHTVFAKTKPTQPDDKTSLALLEMALKHLPNHGFERYEISAFAKPGYRSHHNIGYWTGRPFLGLGPSAFSFWEGKRFRNQANLHRWAKALDTGSDPVDFSEHLPPEQSERERLAVRLRLFDPFPAPDIDLSHLEAAGWIRREGNMICLTEQGALFYDSVATMII